MWLCPLLVIVIAFEVSPKLIILGPIGTCLCHSKCSHIGQCSESRFYDSLLRCELVMRSDTRRHDNDSIWPCGLKCDGYSECIHTRTKSSLCVKQIVNILKPTVVYPASRPSNKPRPQRPSPSRKSNKPGRLRPSPSRKSNKGNTQRSHPSKIVYYSNTQRTSPSRKSNKPSTQRPSPSRKSNKPTTQRPSPSTKSNKPSTQRPTPSRKSNNKGNAQKRSSTVTNVKSTQPKGIEGLLTISKVGGNKRQFNLMILSTKVWHTLHKIQGSVTALRSRSNDVYWCQKVPTACGTFTFIPETMKYKVRLRSHVSGREIAVDEGADIIVVISSRQNIDIYSLRWKRKTAFPSFGYKHLMAVNPRTRILYVSSKYYKDLIAFDYEGVPLQKHNIQLKHTSRCIDVDPTGEMLYSSDISDILTMVSLSVKSSEFVHIRGLRWSRVLVYNTRLYIVNESGLMVYDKQGLRLNVSDYRISRRRLDHTSPVGSFIGSFISQQ